MDEEKYNECKLKIKIWEAQFKKKRGRIPSKYDFQEADKSVRDAYRTYCKMKTAMLEETLRDVLDEDMDDTILGISREADPINCAPFKLPDHIPFIDESIEEDTMKKASVAGENLAQNDVWGDELNRNVPKEKKKPGINENEEKGPKINTRKRFTMRNPRKSFTKSKGSASKYGNSSNIQINQKTDETLPDLETILLEKCKGRTCTETSNNVSCNNKISKTLVNTVDSQWLRRQVSDTSTDITNNAVPVAAQTSFGISGLKIKSNKDLSSMVRHESIIDRESDSDAVIPNSEDELTVADIQELLSSRHVMKRRRLMNASQLSNTSIVKINNDELLSTISVQIEKSTYNENMMENECQSTTEKPKETKKKITRQQPLRRSTRRKTDDVTYHYLQNMSDSDREVDPFDCGNDDSDDDPSFKDESIKVETNKILAPEKKKEKITVSKKVFELKSKAKYLAKKAANNMKYDKKKEQLKSKLSYKNKELEGVLTDVPNDEMKDFDNTKEFNDYILEFGIERVETIPRMDEKDLINNAATIQKFICSESQFATKSHSEIRPTSSNSSRSTAHAKLQKRVAAGSLNENYIRLNLKKKVFVRGKKVFNFSQHKKSLWKKKKAAALSGSDMDMGGCDGGVLECFKCGGAGHMARQCSAKGDNLLPLNAQEESSYPTLQEAEEMVVSQKLLVHARNPTSLPENANRKLLDSKTEVAEPMNLEKDFEPESVSTIRHVIPKDFLKKSGILETLAGKDKIEPIYKLDKNQDIIPTPDEVYEALKLFGHTYFRNGQEKAIMRILSGQSTLVTLSTGSGKSLCYQLPAYLFKKYRKCITLVISPLVSLMEDQVQGIPSFLNAQCLHTNQTEKQRDKVMEMIKNNAVDILLVSPEAVVAGEKATGFGALLRQLPAIAFACIDEAHCVSQWSHNFRPSYLMICRVLKDKLKVNTILGLTATATKSTKESIIQHLAIPDAENGVIQDTPIPDNLVLTVSKDAHRDIALVELIKSNRFDQCYSIIVYCTRREECERVAGFIRTSMQDTYVPPGSSKRKRMNFIAEPYHAGMPASRRRTIQNAFMSGELRIVVATVAFGMGINKADIRAVIHYNMPKSFENYVQEIGRAGRDGLPSHCHVFLDSKGSDKNELRRHIYANSIDRHVIRKLLQKIFVPCTCNTRKNSITGDGLCPRHEVSFSIASTIQMLDVAEENIETLLCYLELHEKQYIQVLSRAYSMCKVFSYGGSKQLRLAANNCPPLAIAIALDMERGITHENSTFIEFPVIDIAAAIGWDSGVVKYQLKQLEWAILNGQSKRTTISVQFHDLAFRVRSPGDLTDEELDACLELLHQRVVEQEKCELQQLQAITNALNSVAHNSYLPATLAIDNITSSNQLKQNIRKYFEDETLTSIDIPMDIDQTNDEIIINDVRAMIQRYPENNFTGRALARIFHGISSPNYPAVIWGRCQYWRQHMNIDFNRIVQLANAEIVMMRG